MTTEETDGPMPLCFSPESFRAAVDRAKRAEQRVEELATEYEDFVTRSNRAAEQHHQDIDRLSLENAQYRANVATLTTEREDSERQYAGLHVQFHDLVRESNGLRDRVATLVEQLGEAERRHNDIEIKLAKHVREYKPLAERHLGWLRVVDIIDDPNEAVGQFQNWRAAGYDGDPLAKKYGAAQPVVEPRDETKPPPGWTANIPRGQLGNTMGTGDVYRPSMVQSLAHSGTEGPLREALEFYADPETYWSCSFFFDPPTGGYDDDFEEVELDGQKRQAPGKRARVALAASPPDGTAPERALLHRFVDHETDPCRLDHHGCCQEHPGAQATGQECAVAEGRRLLATRPPDGMPGEPTEGEEPITLADLLADLECMLREADAAFANGSDYDYESEIRKTIHRFSPDSTERATPPTVPGEPPCEGYCAGEGCPLPCDASTGHTCKPCTLRNAAPPTPPLTPERAPLASKSAAKCSVTAGHGIHVCVREDGHDGDHVWDFEVDAGRAPLDEAAVRAEVEVMRDALRDIWHITSPGDADPRVHQLATVGTQASAKYRELVGGTRRSEGAG